MRLTIRYAAPRTADGQYQISAPGCQAASLHWADRNGALPGWTALAQVPLGPGGESVFGLTGGRSVPPGATHVMARSIAPDLTSMEETMVEIPLSQLPAAFTPRLRLCVMSDLHLAAKPGRIRRALRQTEGADLVLIPGDMTNNGLPEQFEQLRTIIEEECAGTPVLAVTGNHDQPPAPLPMMGEGVLDWNSFQDWLLDRAGSLGVFPEMDASGAWRAQFRGLSVFGLNAVTHFRRFSFPEGAQLTQLDQWLAREDNGSMRLVLCHAPLAAHNPQRMPRDGKPPYLNRDAMLQEIIDRHGRTVFLSGHTHITLNEAGGCVSLDAARRNLYINDGSICPGKFHRPEPSAPQDWVDGALVWLETGDDLSFRMTARTFSGQQWVARSCYQGRL